MTRYEYKAIPAPEKPGKIKGVKGPARFAATLEELMNELGAEGWRYLRADTLPVEERSGLTSKQTTYRNILVFIREIPEIVEEIVPEPVPPAPIPAPTPEPEDSDLTNLFDTDPETPENPEEPRS